MQYVNDTLTTELAKSAKGTGNTCDWEKKHISEWYNLPKKARKNCTKTRPDIQAWKKWHTVTMPVTHLKKENMFNTLIHREFSLYEGRLIRSSIQVENVFPKVM